MDSPYQPPPTPPTPPTPPDEAADAARGTFWKRMAIASLVAGLAATVGGGIAAVTRVSGAFDELGRTGQADPAKLAGEISGSLIAAAAGLLLLILSLLLFFFSWYRHRRHGRRPGAT
jgi:hypothetical protein